MNIKPQLALLLLLVTCQIVRGSAYKVQKNPKAVFTICSCSLNKFPEVKDFLENDLPEYGHLLTIKFEKDEDARVSFLDEEGAVQRRILIEAMSRHEIRELLRTSDIRPFFTLEEITRGDEL